MQGFLTALTSFTLSVLPHFGSAIKACRDEAKDAAVINAINFLLGKELANEVAL